MWRKISVAIICSVAILRLVDCRVNKKPTLKIMNINLMWKTLRNAEGRRAASLPALRFARPGGWRWAAILSVSVFAGLFIFQTICFAKPLVSTAAEFQSLTSTQRTDARPAAQGAAQPQAVTPQTSNAEKQPPKPYTLSPERAAKAIAYARAIHWLYFADFLYTIVALLSVIRLRVAPVYRNWAERVAGNRFMQAVVFGAPLLLTLGVLGLPAELLRHWISRRFDQSIQSWGSWFWDWSKGEFVSVAFGVILIWLLYAGIRRSPKRWWFYVWTGALPILVLTVFIAPLVIEPMFFTFTPLAETHTDLAGELERIVTRAGQDIPLDRMYLMNASSKLKSLNAYVTGLGASRRVVVWDTTISHMTNPQISFVFGHEMGHYVLGHIRAGMIFTAGALLVSFFLGFHVLGGLINRLGGAWGLRGVSDWASLPVLLLIFIVLSFVFTPVDNAYSRHLEHQADQYGLEVVHGILPDAAATAAESFQILGDIDLEEPAPSWLVKVWFYSHPPIRDRVAFAYSYDPWSAGQSPRFVK